MGKYITHPLAPLLTFSLALTALLVTYLAVGLAPSPLFQLLASFWWSILLAFWIVADARRKTGVPCFDFGFFCYLFLPVAVPWYCIFVGSGHRSSLVGAIHCGQHGVVGFVPVTPGIGS
jgi:hypothetical protein